MPLPEAQVQLQKRKPSPSLLEAEKPPITGRLPQELLSSPDHIFPSVGFHGSLKTLEQGTDVLYGPCFLLLSPFGSHHQERTLRDGYVIYF